MSDQTLFGKLYSKVTTDYEHTSTVLRQHAAQINRFGEAIKDLPLKPHARARLDKTLGLSAVSERGHSHVELFDKLRSKGFTISDPQKTEQQFTDGFVMWTVVVKGSSVEFCLLYHVEVEAA